LLHNHPHPSSGAGTTGQKWPQYKGQSHPTSNKKALSKRTTELDYYIVYITYISTVVLKLKKSENFQLNKKFNIKRTLFLFVDKCFLV
jgi:hypothetical protein